MKPSPMNAPRRRKVRILTRRMEFLRDAEYVSEWALAEIAALEFALETIAAHHPEKKGKVA